MANIDVRRKANWLGSSSRIIKQLIVSVSSYITLPFASYQEDAVCKHFQAQYNGKYDPLCFDGKNKGYFEQIETVYNLINFEGKQIIDLGCGDISLYYWLTDKLIKPKKYIGVDFATRPACYDEPIFFLRKDLRKNHYQFQKGDIAVAVNSLCYLSDQAIDSLCVNLPNDFTFIIIEPFPGIFWDAYFDGCKLYYRSINHLVNRLSEFGLISQKIAVDYGLILFRQFLLPLSYCIVFKKNNL